MFALFTVELAGQLVIGAVLVAGAAAPKLVTRDMIKTMMRGSMLVEIAIDQGGCFSEKAGGGRSMAKRGGQRAWARS